MNRIYCAICDSDITYKGKRETHEDGCICINCYDHFYCKECGDQSSNINDGLCEGCTKFNILSELKFLFEKYQAQMVIYWRGSVDIELELFDYEITLEGFNGAIDINSLEKAIHQLRGNK